MGCAYITEPATHHLGFLVDTGDRRRALRCYCTRSAIACRRGDRDEKWRSFHHGKVVARTSFLHIGVTIFFVISGFILGRLFASHYLLGHKKPALRSCYLRRLTRLEPPYLINIAVTRLPYGFMRAFRYTNFFLFCCKHRGDGI